MEILKGMLERQGGGLPSMRRSMKAAMSKASIASIAASHELADAEIGCRIGAWLFVCDVFQATKRSDGPSGGASASHRAACRCLRNAQASAQLVAWASMAVNDHQFVPSMLKSSSAWQDIV